MANPLMPYDGTVDQQAESIFQRLMNQPYSPDPEDLARRARFAQMQKMAAQTAGQYASLADSRTNPLASVMARADAALNPQPAQAPPPQPQAINMTNGQQGFAQGYGSQGPRGVYVQAPLAGPGQAGLDRVAQAQNTGSQAGYYALSGKNPLRGNYTPEELATKKAAAAQNRLNQEAIQKARRGIPVDTNSLDFRGASAVNAATQRRDAAQQKLASRNPLNSVGDPTDNPLAFAQQAYMLSGGAIKPEIALNAWNQMNETRTRANTAADSLASSEKIASEKNRNDVTLAGLDIGSREKIANMNLSMRDKELASTAMQSQQDRAVRYAEIAQRAQAAKTDSERNDILREGNLLQSRMKQHEMQMSLAEKLASIPGMEDTASALIKGAAGVDVKIPKDSLQSLPKNIRALAGANGLFDYSTAYDLALHHNLPKDQIKIILENSALTRGGLYPGTEELKNITGVSGGPGFPRSSSTNPLSLMSPSQDYPLPGNLGVFNIPR